MKELKTLIVNGNEYTVTDQNAARIDDGSVGDAAWSSKNIVDRLCPAFTKSGAAVVCHPVEGYPMEVVSYIQPTQAGDGHAQIKLTRCGKNLCSVANSAGTNDAGHIEIRDLRLSRGVTLTASADITRGNIDLTESGAFRFYVYYTDNSRTSGSAAYGDEKDGLPHKKTVTLETSTSKDVKFLRIIPVNNGIEGDWAENIQIELGTTATDYEPYRGDTFIRDLDQNAQDGSLNWQTGVLTEPNGNIHQQVAQEVLALSGVNILYSNTGETVVAGRADPTAAIEELTNAVIALGGNI